jgi:DNA-binding GntR family transcriptional regulator
MADLDADAVQIPSRRGRRRFVVDNLSLKPAAPEVGQTLQDAVYQQMRSALMVGAFKPGQALSVRSLAASLGTSGMPVKDALRRLVAEGVLTALPQSSFVVTSLTSQRFMDLTQVRVRLETLLAAKAAEIAPRSLVRTLTGLNERYRLAQKRELLQANFDFHFTIYTAAQMPDVRDITMYAWLRIGALFSLIEEDLDQEEDYAKHGRIIEAIAARDPARAAAMVEQDIMATATRISPKIGV